MHNKKIHFAQNFGGPIHYLGNRFLTLPNAFGHMVPDQSWLIEHFSIILANSKGKKFKRCIEPFAGCASWSLAAMELGIGDEYIINDSNEALINVLRFIQTDPTKVKESYSNLVREYDASSDKKAFFLGVIESYNALNIDGRSLLLPFIINYSWGGSVFYYDDSSLLYYENTDEEFDRVLDQANLSTNEFCQEVDRVAQLLNANQVTFESGDFEYVLSDVQAGDFVSLNPPYPENIRSASEKFGMYQGLYSPGKLHLKLVDTIRKFESRGIAYFMTYGFYNPEMHDFVIKDDEGKARNHFRLFGYEGCAFGVALDQMYWSSSLSIPSRLSNKIIPAHEILKGEDLSVEQAIERFSS